ncbi:MAG: hypothetical protein UV68_C0046G0011 [Candidatus Collierbacteria bacterium GW2011_GWC2_43_12]|uniref:Glycosyltransferase 2-like domain-containing protein n=1 Tax=Candidatus Collierbacteria bacterium GW2011_GWC2_43_12 TaxID=1618390 RepID=A0A0G1D3X1_9BACT|nr:MAG: hypothetical protein UV68_C0046G0011 [Candidatus Collierbacteria bacterium GW2011_GWC2_43_12]
MQSRWTFAHEIARLLRQSISSSKFFSKYAYAHVVGHGLIIRKNVLGEVDGFPTGTMTEDLFLGYLLRSKGYEIFPIPHLELADSPKTLRGLWDQKYVWFWGPMKNISYLKYVSKFKRELGISSVIPSIIFTLEGLLSAFAWLVSGPMILILILSPFFSVNQSITLLAYLSVFIYGPLQYLYFYINMDQIHRSAGSRYKINLLEVLQVTILSIPVILFNSIPPYFSIFNELKSTINKTEIYKPKTDD